MFTSLPFWILSLFFSAFKTLLVGALGGLLSIYARFGNEYANSIRWSRQGGYLEMAITLRNSFRYVPKSSVAVMFAVVTASILSMFAGVSVSRMVRQSEIEVNPSYLVSKTKHIMPELVSDDGWSTVMGQGSTMESVLLSMINEPQNNPDAVPGRRYRPRTYDYKVACNRFDVTISRNLTGMKLEQPNSGCAVLYFDIVSFYIWNPENAVNERISDGKYKIVASGTPED
ncbi:hypothetical protein BGZ50_009434, partial [Haplosporangium sp. Z 11]